MVIDTKELSLGRCVSFYMMSSYLYYRRDRNVISDGSFDNLCKRLDTEWDNIDHPHKKHIDRDHLKAGTGFYMRKYPTMVVYAANQWYNDEVKGKR